MSAGLIFFETNLSTGCSGFALKRLRAKIHICRFLNERLLSLSREIEP